MDFYEDYKNFYNRLESEFKKYGRLIIAVDFDDTIYDYHRTGKFHDHVISLLRRWRNHAFIYIFTARNEARQKEVEMFCKGNDIPYENINIGCQDKHLDFGSRKPFYSVLLDDRSGLGFSVSALEELITKIENGELKNE